MDKMHLMLILAFVQVMAGRHVMASPISKMEFTCPSDGFYAIPNECSSNYYACVDGTAHVQTCPGATIFDPETLQCTSPDKASCRQTTTSEPLTCNQNGNYALPGQCSSNYIICIDGTAYPAVCPGNGIFDPVTLICTSAQNATCTNQTTSTTRTTPTSTTPTSTTTRTTTTTATTTTTTRTTTPASTTTSGPFTCPPTNGNYPIPGQCSPNYYICIDGVSFPASCPGVNIFDPELLICVKPENATCNNSNSTSTTRSTTQATTTSPGSSTTSSGSTSSSTTSPGTTGSSTTSPRPTGSTPSGTTSGPFNCPDEDGMYPNPDDCKTYYVCANGNAFLVDCPIGTVYNPAISQCDYPANVPGCEDGRNAKKLSWFPWLY